MRAASELHDSLSVEPPSTTARDPRIRAETREFGDLGRQTKVKSFG